MINLLVLVVSGFLSLSAHADPIPNINGMSGRLETITCDGGYMTPKSRVDGNIYQRAELECKDVPADKFEVCFEKVVKKNTIFVNSIFKGVALEGTKQMKMTITQKNSGAQLFSSIRVGAHGDGVDGNISLMFSRVGVSGDQYMIETGNLSNDATSVPVVIVPVMRRLLADQVYFFFNCRLNWIH